MFTAGTAIWSLLSLYLAIKQQRAFIGLHVGFPLMDVSIFFLIFEPVWIARDLEGIRIFVEGLDLQEPRVIAFLF